MLAGFDFSQQFSLHPECVVMIQSNVSLQLHFPHASIDVCLTRWVVCMETEKDLRIIATG